MTFKEWWRQETGVRIAGDPTTNGDAVIALVAFLAMPYILALLMALL